MQLNLDLDGPHLMPGSEDSPVRYALHRNIVELVLREPFPS